MPTNNTSPIPAIMAEVDARHLSGDALFKHGVGGASVTMATFTSTQGIYEDILDLLHGRGSQNSRSLTDMAASAWASTTRPGTLTTTLGADDKIVLSSSLESFEILASPDNEIYGFPAAGTTAIGAGPYTITAPNSWRRGLVEDAVMTISNLGGTADIPNVRFMAQSVLTIIRETGNESDADDGTVALTIEGIHNNIYDNVNRRIRWFVTDDGKVGWAAPTTVTAGVGITFLSDDFRQLIGWSGNEVIDSNSTITGLDYQIGDYYAPRVLVPSRPLERVLRETETVDSAIRQIGGKIVGNKLGSYNRVIFEGWIDGPTDATDLHRHWLQNVIPYLSRGRRCSVYMDWGDPRRGLESFAVTTTQDAYDLLYTTEKDGERGRFRGRVVIDSRGTVSVVWPSRNRRRAPFTLTLQKAED